MIPGNDDAMRAISFYCDLAQAAVLDGLQTEMMKTGGDAGAAAAAPVEPAVAAEVPAEEAAAEADAAPAEEAALAAEAAAEKAPAAEGGEEAPAS